MSSLISNYLDFVDSLIPAPYIHSKLNTYHASAISLRAAILPSNYKLVPLETYEQRKDSGTSNLFPFIIYIPNCISVASLVSTAQNISAALQVLFSSVKFDC